MKKYLAPIGLILALSLGFALAQSANQAMQVSQDPTGKIGYDNVQGGIYLPGHLLTTTRIGPAPSVTGSTCGTTAPSVVGTDFAGVITVGTSATTSTTALTITQTSTASNTIAYICTSTS